MVLGKFPVTGRPTIWMIVGQGPIALAVGAGVGCLDIFTLPFLSLPHYTMQPSVIPCHRTYNTKQFIPNINPIYQ